MNSTTRRATALQLAGEAAHDLVAEGDDEGGQGFVAEAVARNEVSIDELVGAFREALEEAL